MCGLFGGLSTTMSDNEVEKVCQLAYTSALRGVDSTGMALGYRKKKDNKFGIHVHKLVQHPADYLREDSTLSLLKMINPTFIIGHTRAATIGAINHENAHPHTHEHITGTHNGTIGGFGDATKSDSRALFERVAKEGITKAFAAADNGAYATVFADARARTVNFFRNKQRPLWLMWDKNSQLLLWASEKGMLQMVADHDNNPSRWKEPFLLREHCLLSIPFGHVKGKVDDIDIEKHAVRYVMPPLVNRFPMHSSRYTEGPPGTSSTRGQLWDKDTNSWNHYNKDTLWDTTPFKDDVDPNEDSCALPSFVSTNGQGKPNIHDDLVSIHGGGRYDRENYKCHAKLIIPTSEAKLVLEGGCRGCGVSHKLEDDVKWYDSDTFLCTTCQRDPMIPMCVNTDVVCG